jgi:hypothetical protein
MTFKVIIKPNGHEVGAYPTYFVERDGVQVGPSGDLTLVSAFSEEDGSPLEFRIYAPGAWIQIDVSEVND